MMKISLRCLLGVLSDENLSYLDRNYFRVEELSQQNLCWSNRFRDLLIHKSDDGEKPSMQ